MRTVLSILLAALSTGCVFRVPPATFPGDFSSTPARWGHELSLTRFGDYAPGEYCVFSSIHDASAVRYMLPIKVGAVSVSYVTTQRSPDGAESETLQMCLQRKGDDLIATYSHVVQRRGATDLNFAGTTVFSATGWE